MAAVGLTFSLKTRGRTIPLDSKLQVPVLFKSSPKIVHPSMRARKKETNKNVHGIEDYCWMLNVLKGEQIFHPLKRRSVTCQTCPYYSQKVT